MFWLRRQCHLDQYMIFWSKLERQSFSGAMAVLTVTQSLVIVSKSLFDLTSCGLVLEFLPLCWKVVGSDSAAVISKT